MQTNIEDLHYTCYFVVDPYKLYVKKSALSEGIADPTFFEIDEEKPVMYKGLSFKEIILARKWGRRWLKKIRDR